jgi:hypothetical protein
VNDDDGPRRVNDEVDDMLAGRVVERRTVKKMKKKKGVVPKSPISSKQGEKTF